MIRKTIFWTHLISGVLAGLVIVMMSFTGVLLTYERQMLSWADARSYAPIDPSAPQLSVDALLAGARAQEPEFVATSLTLEADPTKAMTLGAGRGRGSRLIDPVSGELLGEGAVGMHAFFGAVTGWHRWFNASGENRGPWRAITGASNLVFLFLLISGLYLWLPKVWNRTAFRLNLWFNPNAKTAKARDFNWHHVFGFWTAIPLIVIVYTATIFYYGWSNDLLYRVFDGAAPAQGPRVALARSDESTDSGSSGAPRLSLDALLNAAREQTTDWERITLQLPDDTADSVSFAVDYGTGGQPQLRDTLVLDAATGAARWQPFTDQTPGRQARLWVRFLHTGEAFGLLGQTIAGVVSLLSLLMVWTGFALAWRRLVSPLLRRA